MENVIPLRKERSSTLDSALELAAQGFRVFPLAAGTKVPPKGFPWRQQATCDPDRIRHLWAQHPNCNVAVATGAGTIVLDVDVKSGKRGHESLEALEAMGLPLDGFRVRTTSGGLHVYLKTDHQHANSVNKLVEFPDIDVRCEGGYVVGPGSAVGGKTYDVVQKGADAPLPGWLHDKLLAATPQHAERTDQPLVDLDQPHNVANAITYLVNRAPQAIEGAGGNTETYKVAGRMRDYGLSESKAWEVMLDHWNEQKASPVWDPEDLLAVIQNAYRYATGAWGGEDMTAWMEVVEGIDDGWSGDDVGPADGTKKQRPRGFYTVGFKEAADMALAVPPSELIEGVLQEGTTVLIFGPTHTGKTFLVVDIAGAVASGRPWAGRKTTKGAVLYVAPEGNANLPKRLAALRHKGVPDDALLFLAPCPVNLYRSAADATAIIAEAKRISQACAHNVRLVILDTLAQSIAGADESAATDVAVVMERAQAISSQLGATVLAIHHTGKDAAKGARGSSAISAAVDTEIEIRTSKGSMRGEIACLKQRDGAKFAPIQYQLEEVILGARPDGRAITSCVVRYAGEADHSMMVSEIAEKWLEALELGCGGKGTADDWAAAYRTMLDPDWQTKSEAEWPRGSSVSRLRDVRPELEKAGRITKSGRLYVAN